MSETDKGNIYQRINAVMHEVEYVQKDSEVSMGGSGGYKAVSHDMVSAVIRPQLVKHGIVVNASVLRSNLLKEKGANGAKMDLYNADYEVHFVNIDSPEDRVSVTINAHANDNGDKAPGKAMSYAVKYAMLKTFSLETGDDEEQRFADPYTEEQHDAYHELIENEDGYGLYMFTRTLTDQAVVALYNSFPQGKKQAGKKKYDKLINDGDAAFRGMVDTVKMMLHSQDIAVTEITDEMSPLEKGLLAKRLDQTELAQLKRIKQAEVG